LGQERRVARGCLVGGNIGSGLKYRECECVDGGVSTDGGVNQQGGVNGRQPYTFQKKSGSRRRAGHFDHYKT